MCEAVYKLMHPTRLRCLVLRAFPGNGAFSPGISFSRFGFTHLSVNMIIISWDKTGKQTCSSHVNEVFRDSGQKQVHNDRLLCCCSCLRRINTMICRPIPYVYMRHSV